MVKPLFNNTLEGLRKNEIKQAWCAWETLACVGAFRLDLDNEFINKIIRRLSAKDMEELVTAYMGNPGSYVLNDAIKEMPREFLCKYVGQFLELLKHKNVLVRSLVFDVLTKIMCCLDKMSIMQLYDSLQDPDYMIRDKGYKLLTDINESGRLLAVTQ